MGVGFVRRTYARRLIKFMERSKEKKRPLPPELREIAFGISRLPEEHRLPALEDALQGKGPDAMSRDMRRAASRQSRLSGKGGPHRRPGAMRTRDPVAQPGAAAQVQRPKSAPAAAKPAKSAPAKPAPAKRRPASGTRPNASPN